MSAQEASGAEERSSLLGQSPIFPSILSAVELLPPAGHLELSRSDLVATHAASATDPLLAEGFHLLLVLHLLTSERRNDLSPTRQESTLDAWHESQAQGRRNQNLWLLAKELLEYLPIAAAEQANVEGGSEHVHVEDILQAPFLVDASTSRMIRVIDLLPHPGVPSELLCHPVITIALVKIWKYGTSHPVNQDLPLFTRFLAMYDSCRAPRTLHAVHLAGHLAYLILLAHLILYPSLIPILMTPSGGSIGIRGLILAIYSISAILFNPLSASVIPHIWVFITILISLPASPSPGTATYISLLPPFCLYLFSLQFPVCPAPMFLLEPAHSLPLSSLYASFILRCLFPAFAFFLPVILVSVVLFSLSLNDPLLLDFRILDLSLVAPHPSRIAYFCMFTLSFLLFLSFTASILLLSSPPSVLNMDDTSRTIWERYGTRAGLEARRSLVRAIVTYSPSARHPSVPVFPPPLNLASLPIVVPSFPRRAAQFAWRIVVGPFALLFAGLWGWGLI